MQAGKTIAAKRERPEADSERERVRRVIRRRKVVAVLAVVVLAGVLRFLTVKVFQGWLAWASKREEVAVTVKEPSVEVIDERTGRVFNDAAEQPEQRLSSRMKEYIANLEEEFAALGYKVVRARVPADKIREIDVEIEGFSGVVKVTVDRNPAVSAEDAGRMMRYLADRGIETVEYIDVRVERKGYWK